jgi:H+-transporting ATPase
MRNDAKALKTIQPKRTRRVKESSPAIESSPTGGPAADAPQTAGPADESLEETLRRLSTSPEGLTGAEAARRLARYGPNEIVDRKKNPILSFLVRFWGPLPWLLELAMIVAFALSHDLEAAIILVLLVFNAALGQYHERGSRKAVELLKGKAAARARVLRGGVWLAEKAAALVPGDVIAVKLGDIVPADARIVSGHLSVDQSSLTGESLPKHAHRGELVYSSTIVRQGQARCMVVETGERTAFGATARLVKTARPRSHQEEMMLAIVRYMLVLGTVALAAVTADAILIGKSFLSIATLAVVFLLGAVPVALPAVLSIVQSFGALELARRGAIVTRLASIEDAASLSVLCLDKTGTLTQNRLSVEEAVPIGGLSRDCLARTAALASRREGSDPIDLAIIEYARRNGIDLSGGRRASYTPFDPSLKRTEAVIEEGGRKYRAVKGAPQTVLSLCPGTEPEVVRRFEETVADASRKGFRAVAVAATGDAIGADARAGGWPEGENLELLGVLFLADPVRPDSASLIGEIKNMGIRPMMLTGDNLAIARETARRVGIGDRLARVKDLAGLDGEAQARFLAEHDGLAEIYPEDKFAVIKSYQAAGLHVGMTGDGVNDAPALKQAETGLAVSGATDVARAAASVVLTEPGLHAVIEAVKTSRRIYQRMLTWVLNKVAKVIEVTVLLTVGFFLFGKVVVSLLGMALLVFANDFVTMSLATDRASYTKDPNAWNIGKAVLAAAVPGLLFAAEGLFVLLAGVFYFHLGGEQVRDLVILNLVYTSQFKVLILRERRHFWSSRPGRALLFFTFLTIAVFTAMGLFGVLLPAFAPAQVFFALGCAALIALLADFPKYWIFRKLEL